MAKFKIGYNLGYGNEKKHFCTLATLDLSNAMDKSNAKDIAIMLQAGLHQRINYKKGVMLPFEKQKEIIIQEEEIVDMNQIHETINAWNATLKPCP
jgi:hypothetical protein